MEKSKNLQLIVIGLLTISSSQVVEHFLKMPDLVSGILMGIGIGIMILSLLRQKLRPNY